MKNQAPVYRSKEEITQRSYDFMQKVKEFCDEETYLRFVSEMRSYQSNSLSCDDLKPKVAFILRNHDVLLEEFHQLISYSPNPKAAKSDDLERMVEFMMKVRALGNGIHGALQSAIAFNLGDSQGLIKRLNVIFRDHTSLKDEFITFLMDFGLLEEPKHGLDAAGERNNLIKTDLLIPKHGLECMNITPSYSVRPQAEKNSSSSWPCNEYINDIYVSKGEIDQSRVKEKRFSLSERRMNDFEDELLKEDMYLNGLISVVEFGRRAFTDEEPPVRFKEVVRRFYADMGKRVPHIFRKDPKRAVQGILGSLQDQKEKMCKDKALRIRKIYDLQQQKNPPVYDFHEDPQQAANPSPAANHDPSPAANHDPIPAVSLQQTPTRPQNTQASTYVQDVSSGSTARQPMDIDDTSSPSRRETGECSSRRYARPDGDVSPPLKKRWKRN